MRVMAALTFSTAAGLLLACSAGPGPEAPGGETAAPETASTPAGLAESVEGTDMADDPYLWLEEVDGGEALAWAEQHNAATRERLAGDPLFAELHTQALAALTSPSRLPAVELRAGRVYGLWQDAAHPRGLWRSASQASFRSGDPQWQTLLDFDALSREEGRLLSFGGATCLPPEHRRCLVALSPGGGDAVEVREFDLAAGSFVDGGFHLPLAKSRYAWRDADSLYVGTDFGPGSMTTSGYPRQVRQWQRGTPLAEAELLYEAEERAVSVDGRRLRSEAGDIDLIDLWTTFWTRRYFELVDGRPVELALPPGAVVLDAFQGRLVVWLREDWEHGGGTHAAGSVLDVPPAAVRAGGEETVREIAAPAASEVVTEVHVTPQGVLATLLDDVRGRLYRYAQDGAGSWQRSAVAFPDHGALHVASVDDASGDAYVTFESFLVPPTLYALPARAEVAVQVMAEEPTFDAAGLAVQQFWAVSADGTRVPYFVVGPETLPADGSAPVWMFSYGGFENALTPSYSGSYEPLHGAYGKLWLERGGVFVLANIRGGGEFGPAWHQAALLANRERAYEDFEAIARDLVSRGITEARRIGIEGRSNGGLLVGATMLRHPELYGAVVCGSPLLDMRRYHRLLAGASWMAEYGDPDLPEQWEFIARYSPYQNLTAGRDLPPVFFYGSTRDDRVHPGHMRKMAAKMEALGYPFEYAENTEGGHSASSTPDQLAERIAATFTFLWRTLGD